jgi:hypothetical protein
MSEQSKSTSSSSAAKSDTSKAADSTPATPDKGDSGKSSRESVGGSSAVHYGFFSNVKTPQYRSGWDEIWNKDNKKKKKKPAAAKAPTREPKAISLSFDELPDEVRDGLAEAARAKLKRSRISYDSRAKAGAVVWRIDCEVTN